MSTTEKALATATFHGLDTMPRDKRKDLATWLRELAKDIVRNPTVGARYAKRFTARYYKASTDIA